MSEENGKACCNCRHNIRTQAEDIITCHCEMDGHYIGYIACFEGWCQHWAKDRSFEEDKHG